MWMISHTPEGRKRPVQKTFLTKPEAQKYVSRLRKQVSADVVQQTAWGVFRMQRYGRWKLLNTFDNPESAKRLARKMTEQFITVKWRKV